MSVYAQCPACGEKFRRPDGLAGKLEKCPECRYVFRLPVATSPPPAKVQSPKQEAPPAPTQRVESAVGPIAEEGQSTEQKAPPAPTQRVEDAVGPIAEEEQSTEQEAPPAPVERAESLIANSEPSKPVDYAALATDGVCAGRPADAVEAELAKHGMDRSEAQQMVEYMSAACHRRQPRKGVLWLRVFGGLGLAILNLSAGLVLHRTGQSARMELLVYGIAAVGLLLFCSGLWRLVVGSRPMRAGELIAAWRQQKE